MSEWKEYNLGEVCDIYDGPHATPNKVVISRNIFLGISSLGFDGRIDPTYFEFVTDEDFKRWTRRVTPQKDDIVFSYETKLGVAAIIPENLNCCLGRRMGLLRVKPKFVPHIVLYAYLSPGFQKTIHERTYHGSTVDRIPLKELGDFPILLPSYQEQLQISEVLSSLDAKIDLLHRQNKTLEQLAETLFRQWFVEEASQSISLGDIAKVSTGKGLKRNEFIENGAFPILGANGEIGRTNNFLTEERLILTGRVGTLGEVKISDDKVWISDNVLIIKPDNNKYFYPIYFTLKRFDFENLNAGSTQPLVTQTDLKTIEINLGNEKMLKEYEEYCSDYFQKIKSSTNQIKTLTRLRDTLLPKLMSGEVRIEMN